jgi:hypothetical protein
MCVIFLLEDVEYVGMKMAVFWVVAIAALMIEATSTSETPVNFYQTTLCRNPEVIFILAAVRTSNLTIC